MPRGLWKKKKMANHSKKSLSKNLTQMKFMQRASQSLDKEETDGAGGLIEKWVAPSIPKPTESQRVKVNECGFVECEDLNAFGRFSYNKFNKEVERLAKQFSKGDYPTATQDFIEEDEGTIPAHEMAKRYEAITSRKFLGKRQRSDIGDHEDLMEERLDLVKSTVDKDGFMKPS